MRQHLHKQEGEEGTGGELREVKGICNNNCQPHLAKTLQGSQRQGQCRNIHHKGGDKEGKGHQGEGAQIGPLLWA